MVRVAARLPKVGGQLRSIHRPEVECPCGESVALVTSNVAAERIRSRKRQRGRRTVARVNAEIAIAADTAADRTAVAVAVIVPIAEGDSEIGIEPDGTGVNPKLSPFSKLSTVLVPPAAVNWLATETAFAPWTANSA